MGGSGGKIRTSEVLCNIGGFLGRRSLPCGLQQHVVTGRQLGPEVVEFGGGQRAGDGRQHCPSVFARRFQPTSAGFAVGDSADELVHAEAFGITGMGGTLCARCRISAARDVQTSHRLRWRAALTVGSLPEATVFEMGEWGGRRSVWSRAPPTCVFPSAPCRRPLRSCRSRGRTCWGRHVETAAGADCVVLRLSAFGRQRHA